MTRKVRINVDKLLNKYGLTQKDLSELADIRQAAISQLSRGFVTRISIEHIEKIANAFDIDDINEIITLVADEE